MFITGRLVFFAFYGPWVGSGRVQTLRKISRCGYTFSGSSLVGTENLDLHSASYTLIRGLPKRDILNDRQARETHSSRSSHCLMLNISKMATDTAIFTTDG